MTDESYYKYWALVALNDRDKGHFWADSAFHENMYNLAFKRKK